MVCIFFCALKAHFAAAAHLNIQRELELAGLYDILSNFVSYLSHFFLSFGHNLAGTFKLLANLGKTIRMAAQVCHFITGAHFNNCEDTTRFTVALEGSGLLIILGHLLGSTGAHFNNGGYNHSALLRLWRCQVY